LFDQQNDPAENTNVAGSHPDIAAKISDYLKTARIDSQDWPVQWKSRRP
jgi:hypothetical protein